MARWDMLVPVAGFRLPQSQQQLFHGWLDCFVQTVLHRHPAHCVALQGYATSFLVLDIHLSAVLDMPLSIGSMHEEMQLPPLMGSISSTAHSQSAHGSTAHPDSAHGH